MVVTIGVLTGAGVTDTGEGGTDVLPAIVGAGSLALSAGSNLYSQWNSRRLYRAYENDYKRWMRDYTRNTGRTPRYPMLSAYGSAVAQQTNYRNSYAGSVGTLSGALGAGAIGLKRYL